MKVSFSHNIDAEVKDQFDAATDEMGGKIYEHLEAALKAYAMLPREIRQKLLSTHPEDRQICLDVLGKLETTRRTKRSQRTRRS